MRKNNKKIIIILVLFISIGFAYLSTNLNIGSHITYNANNWDIYFDNIREDTYKSSSNEAQIDNKTTINFSVILDSPGSTYTLYADIVNDGTIDAMLDSWNITNTLDEDEAKAIDIVVSYSDGTALTKNDLLRAKKRDYIKVYAVYKDTISNEELLSSDGNLEVSVTLNYIQSDDDYHERIFKNDSFIKNLNTEGTTISTTDHDGELRFIGANPNNYVSFNNQKWRIIGVFDGKLKLIQDSIGTYSWDTNHYDVNRGWGVNQWGPSTYTDSSTYTGGDLMKLLNPGYEENTDYLCNNSTISSNYTMICGDGSDENYTTGLVNNSLYWNAKSGLCYSDGDYGKKNCNFTSTGLKDEVSKNMIDDYVWKLGSLDVPSDNIWDGRVKADLLYKWERSTNDGKQCSNTIYCSDTINRTVEWTGKVGLMYPSDWVYATGGGTEGRDKCLSYTAGYVSNTSNWSNTYKTCYEDNWLHNSSSFQWTMTPRAFSSNARLVFHVTPSGYVYDGSARNVDAVRPVVYLKSNVSLDTGDGSIDNPFILTTK